MSKKESAGMIFVALICICIISSGNPMEQANDSALELKDVLQTGQQPFWYPASVYDGDSNLFVEDFNYWN